MIFIILIIHIYYLIIIKVKQNTNKCKEFNRETEQSKRKKNRELTNFLKKYLAKVKFFFIYIHSSSSSILVDKE